MGGGVLFREKFLPAVTRLMAWGRLDDSEDAALRQAVYTNFAMLGGALRDFQHSLRLFDYLSMTPDVNQQTGSHFWPSIAQRDSALQLYHFGFALGALSENLGGKVSILPSFDRAALRQVRKRFQVLFPDYELARHAIAHHAEINSTPQKVVENALTPEGVKGFPGAGPGSFTTYVNGRTYSVTLRGAMRSVTLSEESLLALADLHESVASLFVDALPEVVALAGP